MKRNASTSLARSSHHQSADELNSHYFSRLMTPQEVAEATNNQPPEVRTMTEGNWVLCGDVSTPMFNLMRTIPARHFPTHIAGICSQQGLPYCVVTHQVERFQHRFLLSLIDPAARAFLESAARSEKLTYMLGNNDGNEAILLFAPLRQAMIRPLLEMTFDASLEEQKKSLIELPGIEKIVGCATHTPSLFSEFSVQHVNVSLLLPTILNQSYRAAIDKASAS